MDDKKRKKKQKRARNVDWEAQQDTHYSRDLKRHLRTTTAVPAGGPPPNADGTVALAAAETCTLAFNTQSLRTDTGPDQQYPIGVVNATLTRGTVTVTATITFDDTAIATIVVTDVSGRFEYDLETNELAYRP